MRRLAWWWVALCACGPRSFVVEERSTEAGAPGSDSSEAGAPTSEAGGRPSTAPAQAGTAPTRSDSTRNDPSAASGSGRDPAATGGGESALEPWTAFGIGGSPDAAEPVEYGGQGGAWLGLDCDEAPVGGCVVDCSSRKRFPFERNAWGGRVCPAHAPVRASTCSIDCSALYSDADPNGDYHDCFTCQAGHYCVAHGAYQIESTRCAEIPASCDADPRPVCGQDGQRYANACAMHQARMDFVAYRPRCPDDLPGFFRCGGVYCRVGIEYCDAWKPDEDGRANEYQCRESACANEGGCECLGFDAGTIDDGVDELTCEEDAGRVYVANTTVMYF